MSKGFGFKMQYVVRFENATACFERTDTDSLTLIEDGKQPVRPPMEAAMGYTHEVRYLIDCIMAKQSPQRASVEAATQSILIVEAEESSIHSGNREAVIRL